MTDEQLKELMKKLDLTIDTKLSGIRGDTDASLGELIKIRYVLEDQRTRMDKIIKLLESKV